MKTKLMIVASALLLAGPAFAQEPLEKAGTEPSTTENAPGMTPSTPEPLDKAGTTPSTTAPAPQSAATPEPLDVSSLRKTRDDKKMVSQLGTDVDAVEDMDIYDANGKKIAEVEGVVEDASGDIKGLIIEHGGFLGIGESEAIMTFDQVQLKNGDLVTAIAEEELPNLPAWKH
jgi:sporulation protein YlmC with PRC-barrel domain